MKSFHYGAVSPALTALAASAALTTGIVWAWRKPLNLPLQFISRVRVKASVVTQTTPGPFQLEVRKLTAMTANFTGGQDTSDPATPASYNLIATSHDRSHVRAAEQLPVSLLAAGNVRIATAGPLASAGAPVATAMVLAGAAMFSATAVLATGVAPPLEFEWTPPSSRLHYQDPQNECLPILDDEGLAIRSTLGTAGATFVLQVEVDWLEL